MSIENGPSEEERKFKVIDGGKKDSPLELEDALEEANMMRAKIGVHPESGRVQYEGRKPTAQEYEAALEAIEDLKETVKNDSTAKKALVKWLQILQMAGLGMLYAGRVIDAGARVAFGSKFKEEMKHNQSSWEDAVADVLNDAASQLKRLKKKAEEYGDQRAEEVEKK